MQENISLLKVHEWFSIAIVIGIILGLACLTSFRGESRRQNSTFLEKYSGFDVHIKGAVSHPGVYHFHSEMKMKELLQLAGVSQQADLRRFNPEATVKKTRILNVPERAMITVYLQGAVKGEAALRLPKGTKVEDLMALDSFSANADTSVLKKKRRLKDNEILFVPILKTN